MSDTVIRIENLCKRYRYGGAAPIGNDLRSEISGWFKSKMSGTPKPEIKTTDDQHFWALQDINLEIKQGDVVGIIGRNGAGKSTLLKILSRITPPTSGKITYHGRVASLLEVGTGFHRELTGRENIYLNGSILGMRRAEITSKFDEIVAFAEVEKFIDTPVKFYSSGMYVRLAFAVAAHLESDILIIDEVLAVGDADFQRKCLGKMGEASKNGKTVLFVSHNMQAVATLCQEVVQLDHGRLMQRGEARLVIEEYLSTGSHHSAVTRWNEETAPGNELVRLYEVAALNTSGEVSYDYFCRTPIRLSMTFRCLKPINVIPNFHVYNQSGIFVFVAGNAHLPEWTTRVYEPGIYRCYCEIPAALLNAGRYFVHAYLSREHDGHPYVHVAETVSFQVADDGTGRGTKSYAGEWPGIIRPLLPWNLQKESK